MAIINLNCVVSGKNSENETFTIEISNDKKYELLKHMVKERLAPLFDSIPSTQITLRSSPNNGPIFKPMIRISQDFTTSPDENGIHIYDPGMKCHYFEICF
ncbi:40614_t:CDS:2 [Gigaspora margarita]|uniref:40614_t:CDS:1 n=1 Tax=Gigaspora margarita TaxID=4874 RepID=A0ABN7UY86_GIGMA|nr:40614_t:CDS:2 [Gigaspora margarita]